MKRIIYRVDDRFIHGQVIEGWINYFGIPNIIIVNDCIAADPFRRLVYESIIPSGSRLMIMTVDEFEKAKPYKKIKKGNVLVIVGSICDMYAIRGLPDDEAYINIGCLATGDRTLEITDSVYLDCCQLKMLHEISLNHDVFVHKLPWEMPIAMKDVIKRLSGDIK